MKNPYPNPAGNFAIVPYELPEGQNEGVITLTDLNGNIKQSFRVDNHIDHLKIETGQLQKGTYLFYLSAGNYTSDTKKLIVQ
nr:T9SS type A sorting domain-containing protein [Bacteroidota bacterium]